MTGMARRELLIGVASGGQVNRRPGIELPLARQARSAGHDVVFATGAELIPAIDRRGFDPWLVGPSAAEVIGWMRAAYPDLKQRPPEQRTHLAAPMLFVKSAAKRAVELIPRAQQWKPDIVVHEETELAGALAAARIGARHVIHGLGLASVKLRAILTPRFARLCENGRFLRWPAAADLSRS